MPRLPTPVQLLQRPVFHLAAPLRWLPDGLLDRLGEALLAPTLGNAARSGDFDALIGRRIRLTVQDAGLTRCFSLTPERRLRITHEASADTEIRGTLQAFLKIATRQVDPDTLFFRRELVILGDTALGHEMKNRLDALDPDSLPASLRAGLEKLSRGLEQAEDWRRRMGEALAHQESLLE